jgi:hypothetical protein
MAVPRDLQFEGAGNYWNTVRSKRRTPRSEALSTPERSDTITVPGVPRQRLIDRSPRELTSEAQRTSLACESGNMGPIKENSMAL